jgi:hypothetical protein
MVENEIFYFLLISGEIMQGKHLHEQIQYAIKFPKELELFLAYDQNNMKDNKRMFEITLD